MSFITRRLTVGLVAACGALGVAASPAAAYEQTSFSVCNPQCFAYPHQDEEEGFVYGTITWYNRTAGVTGEVNSYIEDGLPTIAHFEAYKRSTKIASETRTVANGGRRGFNFTTGDTNLVGGIDRIKITVCTQRNGLPVNCSAPVNYSKP
ncbi:hypothetical protein [Streptomyces sp. NPDC048845]|uniref:hypothetical protein n=1 Tax=Streptomyces sp. NPDC048845 TaxID=3155390 RepID=UPI003438C828